MVLKECAKCKKLIPYGKIYCDECQKIAEINNKDYKRKRDLKYNQKRNKQYTAFYNSKEWKNMRALRMQTDNYKCQQCGQIAEEVDHIIPIQKDWSKRLDWNNTQALCTDCHNKKHDRFQSKSNPRG